MSTVLVSAKHQSIAVPYSDGLANLMPSAKAFSHPTYGRMLVVPHKQDVVKLVRNMGVNAPPPILHQYDWNGDTPFETQKMTAAMLTMNRRAYVLSEMGTGKTRASLHAITFLRKQREINRVLVVAPLSTLTFVWDREIMRYFPFLTTSILHGTREKRLEALKASADVYIINHDGVFTILPELQARRDIDLVLIDELAAFRNARTRRWKSLNSLLDGRKFVWGMTGSPTPNEPSDAWAQCKLLTPNSVPKYYKQFRTSTMQQVSQFKWIARPDATDIVHKAMQPSLRFTREDCIELPPIINVNREVELSKQQATAFKSLMEKFYAEFKEGKITAANEGVKWSKLLQVSAGWVYTNDRGVVSLDNQARIDATLEVIDEAESKVIVFVDYIHAAKALHAELAKHVSADLVIGETPKKERDQIFARFQTTPHPRVLVANARTMSHGLTLTAASVIVWFSPTASLETYEQACARISRPGQNKKQVIVHLTGNRAESRVYKRLQNRATLQGSLLELFESQENEA